MTKRAFAIAAHPDDIEFMMAGTLILLKNAGYEIHYMNVGNGSCGTNKHDIETIVSIRRGEAINACKLIGAIFHESLVNDIEIFYEREILFKIGAIIREIEPEIILTHSPNEYMEDHSNTCRLAVSAAFCRTMTNFPVNPPIKETFQGVRIYHAMPYGLTGPLNEKIIPDVFVDISNVIEDKRKMLAMHKSQKEWLDESQGMDSYLITMTDMCRKMGEMSAKYEYAEAWRMHSHLGFCEENWNPLIDALGAKYIIYA